jgi:hypothetical protein
MLEKLSCPSCGASQDAINVVADTGRCSKCRSYYRVTRGNLALTSKYGSDNPGLEQKRVEADLAVQRDHERNCRGELEVHKEELNWSVEQHAKFNKMLPESPVLLELEDVLGSWKFFGISLLCAPVGLIAGFIVSFIFFLLFGFTDWVFKWPFSSERALDSFLSYFVIACGVLPILIGVFNLLRVMIANGSKPQENARRNGLYEEKLAAAMRDAVRVKDRKDYEHKERIRMLIVDIESTHETVENISRDYEEKVRTSQRSRY